MFNQIQNELRINADPQGIIVCIRSIGKQLIYADFRRSSVSDTFSPSDGFSEVSVPHAEIEKTSATARNIANILFIIFSSVSWFVLFNIAADLSRITAVLHMPDFRGCHLRYIEVS